MSKTFDKAKTRNNKKWYIVIGKRYTYNVFFTFLLPIVLLRDKISKYAYTHATWNEARAIKILNYQLPKIVEWVEEDNAYYYCMNWSFCRLTRGVKLIDKKWVNKFCKKLHGFVQDGYQNEKYLKSVEQDIYGDTWVKFIEKS